MGISMVLALVIGIAIGYYLDKWFQTNSLVLSYLYDFGDHCRV